MSNRRSILEREQREQQIVEQLIFGHVSTQTHGAEVTRATGNNAATSSLPSTTSNSTTFHHPSSPLWTPPHRRMRRRSSSHSMLSSPASKSSTSAKAGLKQWLKKSLKRSIKRNKTSETSADDDETRMPQATAPIVGGDIGYYYTRTFAGCMDSPRTKARASSFRLGGVLSTIPNFEPVTNDHSVPDEMETIKVHLMTSRGPNWTINK
jgi:hypothetical protein